MRKLSRPQSLRRPTRADVSLVLAALALLIAATGVTPAEATRAMKKALNAKKVNGISASKVPTPGKLLPLGPDGKFPSTVVPVGPAGPRGPRGAEGPAGVLGAAGGDLAGSYPNPTLRPGAVKADDVANRIVFRAHSVATQTTPTQASFTVLFGGEAFDPRGVFDPGDSKFTAPVGGYYRFDASVLMSAAPGDGARVLMQLLTSRSEMAIRGTDMTTRGFQQAAAGGLMRLEAGDTVEVSIYTDAPRNVGSSKLTWFSGEFVAPL